MSTSGALDGQILVTGGAGFIGSALVWALNQRGRSDIVITDFLGADEKWRNLVPLRFRDYVDAGEFRRRLAAQPGAFGQFSAVFHLGACSATTETNAAYLADNNYAVTRELAAWALASGARFIYASSAATYGDGAQGMSDQDDNLARLRPLNAYGYSKQLFDLHAQREGWLRRIVGLKYFNVFGPNEDHKGEMRSLVHKAYQQVLASGRIRLFKSYRPDYRGRRAEARFSLREGRGRDDAAFRGGIRRAGRRALQPRFGRGEHLDRAGAGASSPPWSRRRTSNSSRCPRSSAASTSITPWRISPSCGPAATAGR